MSVSGSSGDQRDDVALVAAVAGGDAAALRVLYDRHAPWLVARLRARCWDDALIADAVQDTFLAVWRGAARWRADGDVGAWIWGIGVRQLVTHLRRAGRQARPAPFRERAAAPSTEERVLESIDLGEAGVVLASLSPELMEVVQAMVFDGLTAKETGRMLGVPEGTVKGRMRKAKSVLRTELAGTTLHLGDLR
ncbi:MAG: RNA polymerase sigma factor [Microthrixaceae bacterium]|nr:RNA polymerase sigma factor [Microthrixaceae bacterium]HPB46186.1 RNA polymerase sigma factor [Microthrixaceae bacterium]